MPKKPTKKDREFVMGFLEDIQWLFAIQNYERSVVFKEEADGVSFADITVMDDYQRVQINIYPRFWEESREYQIKIIMHELVHTWIYPIQRIADNLFEGKLETEEHIRHALERTVCSVENAVHGLLLGRYRYSRDAYKKWLKH